MISQVVDYFKDPENFSILLFLMYVFILTQIIGAFVMSLCWIPHVV